MNIKNLIDSKKFKLVGLWVSRDKIWIEVNKKHSEYEVVSTEVLLEKLVG